MNLNTDIIILLSEQLVIAVILLLGMIKLKKVIETKSSEIFQEIASGRQSRGYSTKREQETLKVVNQIHKKVDKILKPKKK